MVSDEVHHCQCQICKDVKEHTHKEIHRQMNLFFSRLDEQQRRWFAALESKRIGHGGIRLMSQITGMNEHTIIRGCDEMSNSLNTRPLDRTRLSGGGRQSIEQKMPSLEKDLQAIVESDTAGDPMSERKWVRRSLRNICDLLGEKGYEITAPTVSRLLKKNGYSLKVNVKEKEGQFHPDREVQFQHIEEMKQKFSESGQPMISVDTKKKN